MSNDYNEIYEYNYLKPVSVLRVTRSDAPSPFTAKRGESMENIVDDSVVKRRFEINKKRLLIALLITGILIITIVVTVVFVFVLKPRPVTIIWNDAYTIAWAKGCDFMGNNLISIEAIPDKCGPECEKRCNCTHFTYANNTCLLKYGSIKSDQAIPYANYNEICGLRKSGLPTC